jgi:hypothetical protein
MTDRSITNDERLDKILDKLKLIENKLLDMINNYKAVNEKLNKDII